MHPSGKYYASVLVEVEGDNPIKSTDGKVAGIDLGLKDFAIVNDGEKTSKYPNPLQPHYSERTNNYFPNPLPRLVVGRQIHFSICDRNLS